MTTSWEYTRRWESAEVEVRIRQEKGQITDWKVSTSIVEGLRWPWELQR